MAKHIEPEALCIKAASLAEAMLDPLEVEAMVRHLAVEGTVPQLWVYGVLPGFENFDNGATGARGFSRRILTYRSLQSRGDWQLINGDWKSAARAAVLPALGRREWSQRARWHSCRLKGRKTIIEDGSMSKHKLVDYETNMQVARQWFSIVHTEIEQVAYYQDDVRDNALESLLCTNTLLQENGARLVLVYMPMSPALQDLMQQDAPQQLARAAALRQLLEAEGVVEMDHGSLPEFSTDLANSRDAAHLNYDGGMRYSALLAGEMAERGLIPQPDCQQQQATDNPIAAQST